MKKLPLPRFEKIEKFARLSRSQSSIEDLFFEGEFIDLHQPKHIVEMGTCKGGWAMYLDLALTNKPNFMTLIENFQGSEWDRDLPVEQNVEILNNLLNGKLTIPYEIVTDNQISSIKEKFDVFRYDGYSDYQVFTDYVDQVENDGIVIIHDFNFNFEVGPIFYALNYAAKNNFYPVWFGKLSAVWVKNRSYKEHLLETLIKRYGLEALKTEWTKTRFRPTYSWSMPNDNFLDFQTALSTQK